MDELTRERFWPTPRPLPPAHDGPTPLDPVILDRRRVLLDDPDYGSAARDQEARLRAQANARHRKLVRAIRQFRGAA